VRVGVLGATGALGVRKGRGLLSRGPGMSGLHLGLCRGSRRSEGAAAQRERERAAARAHLPPHPPQGASTCSSFSSFPSPSDCGGAPPKRGPPVCLRHLRHLRHLLTLGRAAPLPTQAVGQQRKVHARREQEQGQGPGAYDPPPLAQHYALEGLQLEHVLAMPALMPDVRGPEDDTGAPSSLAALLPCCVRSACAHSS